MNIQTVALAIALPVMAFSLILVFIRLVRGPSLPDRVVALDLMTMLGIGMAAIHAIATGQRVFLDVAMILALLSFLSTVAFAYYIERRKS